MGDDRVSESGSERDIELGAAVLAPPRDARTGRVAALRDPAGATFTVLTPAAAV